ncbi:MAG: beta-galactosidase, partial [Chitinophagaceae bacterium]|nr:beta-galactosidase [Chitinophagaceae bacterium]
MKKYILFIVLLCFISLYGFSQIKQIAGFTIPQLSPKPTAVASVQQAQISLDGEWSFRITGREAQHKIQVPGEWEMQGFKVNEGEVAVYSKALIIPADWKGKRIKIRFDGVSSNAVVKLNGVKLAEHEGSFVPFEADLSSAVRNEKNILEVEVQALTVSDKLACTSKYVVHTVGGILRKVTLFVLPEINIADITINTTFDRQYKNASLIIGTSIINEPGVSSGIYLRYTLKDAGGKNIVQKIYPVDSKQANTITPVKAPIHWTPETPYLYQLKTELVRDGISLETITQAVGFRQVEIKGNKFYVNGMPVKLHGVNRHSIHPLTGRTINPALERKDAELFRAANCNYIRTSHYPPTEEFLNACDELGLFVESEASLCWIQHGASPIWKKWSYTDKKFLPFMVNANIENVWAAKNHPSVIIWSLGNESYWSELWQKVNAVVKELDATRPTSFHDQCWGGFNNAGSEADIANYHYPGINGPSATDTMTRPTLFGEYAHLSTYNRKELLTDPGVRSVYNAPLVRFYDSIYAHDGNLGGAIWSGIDDIFHMPDGRIIGYGPWGPIDAWRRPKPEYWGMKKAYSPVRVININQSPLNKVYIELTIQNRYDFISTNAVRIETIIDGKKALLSSNIAPHKSGILKIPVSKDAQNIYVSFTDPRGFIADEENIILQENTETDEQKKKDVKLLYTDYETGYIVKQGDISYAVSKATGIITSAFTNGKNMLSQGPVFCIVPMNSDDGGKPNVAGETYQNNIFPLKNYPLYILFASNLAVQQNEQGIKIDMEITFKDGTGKQSYFFTTDGKLITEYEVEYTASDLSPYQYGMLLQLPKDMDRLSWKRKGEFSTYPDYDIARNEGMAMLNAKNTNAVEEWGVVPGGHWKDDANELGSNDFRSTKKFIIKATLQDGIGNHVTVNSDGTQ